MKKNGIKMEGRSAAVRALIVGMAMACGAQVHANVLLYSDNFNSSVAGTLDGNDANALPGRWDGTSYGNGALTRSGVIGHDIAETAGSQDDLLAIHRAVSNIGRVRFEGSGVRYDFASDWTAGASGYLTKGLRVEFDWQMPNTGLGSDWLSISTGFDSVGLDPSLLRTTHAGTDASLLLRRNGETETWDNGAWTLGGTATPTTSAEPGTYNHVMVDFMFDSLSDGESVTMNAWFNGTQVVAGRAFSWAGNGDGSYIELETWDSVGDKRIDNLAITAIPEPAVAVLVSASGLGLLMLRRIFMV